LGFTALSNAAQDGYEGEAQLFLSDTLAQTFNNLSSALTGAAITDLALAKPFIAAGAAVGFIRCCLLFLKGAHGLSAQGGSAWYFFARPNGFIRAGSRKR
jgi:hypothetical protein